MRSFKQQRRVQRNADKVLARSHENVPQSPQQHGEHIKGKRTMEVELNQVQWAMRKGEKQQPPQTQKKPRTQTKHCGPSLLLRCNSPLDKVEKALNHVAIGILRHFQNSSFATVRLVYNKHDPPTFHSIVLELPAMPIMFPPSTPRFDGRGSLSVVLRLIGEEGEKFRDIYQRLLKAVAFALSVDDNAWKALDWGETSDSPRPSTEQLLSWAKGAIMEDRMHPDHLLLRIRIPNGPKPFLLSDARDMLMEDGREPDELPTCTPQSLLPHQQLEGLLSVTDLWLQMKKRDNEEQEVHNDAGHPLQWGLTLTAKQLTVKPADFEEEEVADHGEEEPTLEELEVFEQLNA
jgi:hypothetical protein